VFVDSFRDLTKFIIGFYINSRNIFSFMVDEVEERGDICIYSLNSNNKISIEYKNKWYND
ncbi:hypothetical protein EWX87_04800, partial [Campylobacter coli]|nr:hypothetical protein [Campylobacter coli]EAL4796873.1 hypothetical protein [Campylobacter coli]EAL6418317.1 hypothetical protein [Campylobacter coli]